MPCYTERQVTVDLTAADENLLVKALEALKFKVQRIGERNLRITRGYEEATIRNGQIKLNESQQSWINEIKQGYAVQAVRTAAKRFGWQMTEQEENQFLIQRRFG